MKIYIFESNCKTDAEKVSIKEQAVTDIKRNERVADSRADRD